MDNKDNNIRLSSEAEFTNEHSSKISLKTVVAMIVLLAIALLLCFLKFRIPGFSSIISVDFSIIPGMIASIAYGPIAGVIITLLKSAIYTAFTEDTFYSNVSTFIIESVFVVFIDIFYSAYIADQFRKEQKINRKKAIFFAGIWASIPTLIVQFLVQRYFLFPKLAWNFRGRGITNEALIETYSNSVELIRSHLPAFLQNVIPKLTETWQAILFVNMPVTFVKLMISTLIAIPIYLLTAAALHFNSKN